MDDPNVFNQFLQNRAGVTVARYRHEVQTFIPTFDALLTVSDDEIDEFVKHNNATNVSRTAAAKIIITSTNTAALKSMLFELKDRELCGIAMNANQLNAISDVQMNTWRGERTRFLNK